MLLSCASLWWVRACKVVGLAFASWWYAARAIRPHPSPGHNLPSLPRAHSLPQEKTQKRPKINPWSSADFCEKNNPPQKQHLRRSGANRLLARPNHDQINTPKFATRHIHFSARLLTSTTHPAEPLVPPTRTRPVESQFDSAQSLFQPGILASERLKCSATCNCTRIQPSLWHHLQAAPSSIRPVSIQLSLSGITPHSLWPSDE